MVRLWVFGYRPTPNVLNVRGWSPASAAYPSAPAKNYIIMESNKPQDLEDAVLILQDALEIRRQRKAEPVQDPDANTEEDVIAAMLSYGVVSIEVLRQKNRYTRYARIILRAGR